MCNVGEIVENDLCCSCHACTSICPVSAINKIYCKGIYIPQVDNDLCIKCGKCLKVCPSYQVDIVSTYKILDLQDIVCKQTYIAYTLQEEIRELSTSGGIITAMVRYLIQNQIYKKAYLLEYENFDGQAVLKSYSNYNDVIKTVKSKYVPASVENVVNDIKLKKISNSIIVGTPCQIFAIKKAMRLYDINEDFVLFIGLFCDKILNYNIYRYYENKFGKFSIFHFRDKKAGQWPGNTLIQQNGVETIIDKTIRMRLKAYFQLNRCRYCIDKLNQLSDISVGDCYIRGFEHPSGLSNIIVRTVQGEKALKACESILHIEVCSVDDIKYSQHIDSKRTNLLRNIIFKSVYTNIPLPLCNGIYLDTKQDREEYSMLTLGANLDKYTNNKSIDGHKIRKQHKSQMGRIKRLLLFIKRLFFEKDNSYKVYIDKAGFINKGAALMLMSVIEQVRLHIPDAIIVIPKNVYNQDISFCIEHGISPLSTTDGPIHQFIYHIIYNKLSITRQKYILPKQIDLVLDAGGFQFSDQWMCTENMVSQRRAYYASFSKKGRKIIFLPQAYGPFEMQVSKDMISLAYKYADIMYAREPISFDYLINLFPQSDKIKISPDFTCLFKPNEFIKVQLPYKQYVIVIVNCRMITHTQQDIADQYEEFIYKILQLLVNKGEKILLLNHEGVDDEQVLHRINKHFSQPLPILTNLNAIDVKVIIKQAKLLISSRFHGVVSGLCQNVPTLCTSWSHKYQELLKEHGCENNILDITNIEEAEHILMDALNNPKQYCSKNVSSIEKKAEIMWQEIFSICYKRK